MWTFVWKKTVQYALCVIVMCQIYSSSCWGCPPTWFIAERRAPSQHHGTVRRWHANTMQHRGAARNCTMRSRNFRATAGGSSIGPWANSLLKATTGEGDRTPASQLWGQLFTERANRPPRCTVCYLDMPDVWDIHGVSDVHCMSDITRCATCMFCQICGVYKIQDL